MKDEPTTIDSCQADMIASAIPASAAFSSIGDTNADQLVRSCRKFPDALIGPQLDLIDAEDAA